MKGVSNIAADLSVPERLLLFCLASGTEWQKVVNQSAVKRMVVHGLVNRDAVGRLELTPQGRAALDALLHRREPSG
jgi:hypothetical protein